MEELLTPAEISRDIALQRCRASLARRSRWTALGLRLQPADHAPDLLACLAWWETLRTVARGPHPVRDLDRAEQELGRVLEEHPTTPVGIALAGAVRRHALPGMLLRGQLQALRRDGIERTFATRKELERHLGQLSDPVGRILLRVAGLATERNDLLADALGRAVILSARLGATRDDWRGGRLNLPVDEVVAHGVDLKDLDLDRAPQALRGLVAQQVREARLLFAKGWPLVDALGPWRGRQLAFLLRWHAAGLGALEARRHDVLAGPPRAGWLRLVACLGAAAVSPAPPFRP